MYNHILVPLDGSSLSEQVLLHARALAEGNPQGKITLLRSVPAVYPTVVEFGVVHHPSVMEEEVRRVEQGVQSYLDAIARELTGAGITVQTELSRLDPADAIVEYAEKHEVDLITIATHGRSGIGRWLLGSVTQKVLQGSTAPVLVVRPVSDD